MRFSSSGDVLADKRYAYARRYRAAGDHAAAADLFAQAVEIAPGWVAGWFALGEAREAAGDAAGAAEAFARALALDPDDAHGVAPRLALLRGETPEALPPGYVRALFDDYAPRFDAHLTKELDYRAPALLRGAIGRACAALGRSMAFHKAFDLGCGTGLMAAALSGAIDSVEGVDLSPAMIEIARSRGCYDHLHVADMGEALAQRADDSVDLVLAADAFCYLADLGPVLAEAARVLRRPPGGPRGLIAFTVEAHGGDGVALRPSLRFAHASAHVRARIADAHLTLLVCDSATLRRDRGEAVEGLVLAAGVPGAAASD